MRFELHIAWRYLFAKKSHNAINIVSGVSAAGVCVATAALVCVLSVMNGFNRVIESLFSQFDPELLITPAEGKYFRLDAPEIEALQAMPEVAVFSPMVQETAMVDYKEHQMPARVMGVDSAFQALCQIDSIITDGYYQVHDGAFDRCVMGRGLASQLGLNAHFVGAVHLWSPKRMGKINLLRPDESLNRETSYIAGTFAVNQAEYDNQLVIISLSAARRLFDYSADEATGIALRLREGTSTHKTQAAIRNLLGDAYTVQNRYEQQADFYRIARMEKWLCALLLAFILMIASFNIIGSLSMLLLEKREDVSVFRSLGASPSQIRRIFLYEGWLISALGALLGLILGLVICLVQEHYGLLKLGNGYDYVLSAYPVAVQVADILLIAAIVLVLGFLAAWYPTRSLRKGLPVLLLLVLMGCKKSNAPVGPTIYPSYASTFTTGRAVDYGVYYKDEGITQKVYSLDLFSDGLVLKDSVVKKDTLRSMEGSGTNLYFSDIFVPDTATRLPAGTYTCATTGEPFTFLPGKSYEGQISGTYLLLLEQSQLTNYTILPEGQLTIAYRGDSLLLQYNGKITEKKIYSGSFTGVLRYGRKSL